MSGMNWAYVAAAGIAAAMTLSGCEVERSNPPLAGQPSSMAPQACQRIYEPVCASRFGNRRTFPNECEARASGYRIEASGQCQAVTGSGGPPDIGGGGRFSQPGGQGGNFSTPGVGDGQGNGQSGGQVCPMIYQPVCARRGSDTRTFPNACRAASDGYGVIYQSECLGNAGSQGGQGRQSGGVGAQTGGDTAGGNGSGGGLRNQQPANGQSCSRAFVPVCGTKNGSRKTFVNACMAQSEGYQVAVQGRCQ